MRPRRRHARRAAGVPAVPGDALGALGLDAVRVGSQRPRANPALRRRLGGADVRTCGLCPRVRLNRPGDTLELISNRLEERGGRRGTLAARTLRTAYGVKDA